MFCIYFSLQNKWAVTMVQLIALLYKDQHVVTLHKLLNLWIEASLSESSEDNESNTSPPDRGGMLLYFLIFILHLHNVPFARYN